MMTVRIQTEPFDTAALIDALQQSGVGAIASFTGIVRSDDGVTAIELEHYPAMTEKSLTRLADEAQARWPLSACSIVHRVGKLVVGQPIVFVGAASAHRAAALEACAFLIDRLKTDAPFWKKEYFGDSAHWVEAKESDAARASHWD
jgi:molybdopterin synthase catalytic subunit